jgi:hypothetical protein
MRLMGRHPFLYGLFFLLLAAAGGTANAETKPLDRIEIQTTPDENIISVVFNVPVRYVSHVMNEAKTEIGVQIQIIQSQEINLEREAGEDAELEITRTLTPTDQLTWNPSAEIPLDKVSYQSSGIGTSTLLISFVTPVEDFRIRQSRDFYTLDFVMSRGKKLSQIPVQAAPEVDIDVPETKSPMSFKSLPLVIYVVNLKSEITPIDMAKIAPIPVQGDQTLYTTKAQVDGRDWYRLRLGFFRTQNAARPSWTRSRTSTPRPGSTGPISRSDARPCSRPARRSRMSRNPHRYRRSCRWTSG